MRFSELLDDALLFQTLHRGPDSDDLTLDGQHPSALSETFGGLHSAYFPANTRSVGDHPDRIASLALKDSIPFGFDVYPII